MLSSVVNTRKKNTKRQFPFYIKCVLDENKKIEKKIKSDDLLYPIQVDIQYNVDQFDVHVSVPYTKICFHFLLSFDKRK